MKREIIYFDNAATSWPKPEATIRAVELCLRETGGSPGRSGHSLSIDAGRVIFNAREALAGLLGIDDPLRIVLTKNATEAINIAVFGPVSYTHLRAHETVLDLVCRLLL